MRATPDAVRASWRTRPADRVASELYCLALTVIPHGNNNHLRKLMTILLTGTWVTLTVGHSAAGWPLPDPQIYGTLSLLVGVVFARMWNIELEAFEKLQGSQDDN